MSQREAIEELQPVYLAPIHLEGSPTTVETHLIVRSCREYQVRHSNLTSVQEDFYRAFIYKDIQFIVTGFLHRSPGTQSKIVYIINRVLFPAIVCLDGMRGTVFAEVYDRSSYGPSPTFSPEG